MQSIATCIRFSSFLRFPSSKRSSFHNDYVYLRPFHQSFLQQSASAKLFADAAKEEAEEKVKSTRVSVLEQQHDNWDGDEKIEDAVLRMLVDKYKPLRTGTVQSAEQKIRQNPPRLAPAFGGSSTAVKLEPSTGSWAAEPLLPSSKGHQPWHTQYKVPSHEEARVKVALLPPPVVIKPGRTAPPDDKSRRLEKERHKRTQHATRLTAARESTLDYKLGIKGPRGSAAQTNQPAQANPVSLKGWSSFIEDKIEKARKAGLFDTVKGRGEPLKRSTEEYNPFIAREEFLMNRIVQRNQAAPPWVEVQMELENAVTTFRHILRQAWIRRATRMLAAEHRPDVLCRLSLDDIKAYRDPAWLEKEKSYHSKAVEELNSLVRKYNGLAPYAVRRAYYMRDVEVGKLYDDCASDILRLISERKTQANILDGTSGGEGGRSGHGASGAQMGFAMENFSFLGWLRLLLRRWFRR